MLQPMDTAAVEMTMPETEPEMVKIALRRHGNGNAVLAAPRCESLFQGDASWLALLLQTEERIGVTLGSDLRWRSVPWEYCDFIAERK
jgi:hypothetical protein